MYNVNIAKNYSFCQWSSLPATMTSYRPVPISAKIISCGILCISFIVVQSDDELFMYFLLVAHRYNAIVHPLRKRMSKQRAFVHIFVIWFGATLFAVPTLIFSRTLVVRLPHESLKDQTIERAICILKWPDGYPWQSRLDFM